MIICRVCGTENERGASFCGSCGAFLEWNGEAATDATTAVAASAPAPSPGFPGAVQPTSSVPTAISSRTPATPAAPAPGGSAGVAGSAAGADPGGILCPSCGLSNEPGRVFCRRCATELAPPPTAEEPVATAAAPPASRPPVAVLGGVVAVVLLGAAGAFLLLPRDPSGPGSEVPSASASPGPASSGIASSGPGRAGGSSDAPPSVGASVPSGSASMEELAGLIAFSAIRGDDADIWVWEPAEDGLRRVVSGSGLNTEPAWSPDGTVLVYRSPEGLRMVQASGDPLDPPDFTSQSQDRNPAWSPDGTRVVFATDRRPYESLDIVAASVDGNREDLVRLVDDGAADWDPAFSPDGRTIVFASDRSGDGSLFRMDASGRGETPIDLGPGVFDDPAVSPDGAWLAFTRRDGPGDQKDLWVSRLDGSEARQLTFTDASENDMAWSPDGRVIAVARRDDAGRVVLLDVTTGDEIGSIGVDGSRSVQPDWWWPRG